jgi:hypothetical protein
MGRTSFEVLSLEKMLSLGAFSDEEMSFLN